MSIRKSRVLFGGTAAFLSVVIVQIVQLRRYFREFDVGEEDIGAYALYTATGSVYVIFLLLVLREKASSRVVNVAMGLLIGLLLGCLLIAYIFLTRW